MPAIRTTRQLLTAYADQESWRRDHDEARTRIDLEEKLAWGVPVFRGLLDLEARTQDRALRNAGGEAKQVLELMPVLYQLWAWVSEFYLKQAQEFVAKGYHVAGLDEFREVVEESRCLLGNLGLENELRPIEELIPRARPGNPDPERYAN